MESKNIFTKKPFVNWKKQYSLFHSKNAASFAKKYQTSLSFLIQGLSSESKAISSHQPIEVFEDIFKTYVEGARLGDALCCLRVSEIYSEEDNFFDVPPNKQKAWLYIILAQFYSLCSPFGLELDITPIFLDFISSMEDDTKLQQTITFLKASDEISEKEYKEIIESTLLYYHDQSIQREENLGKFREMFESYAHLIDDLLTGAFLMNMFTGNYGTDSKLLENEKVHMYLNNRIIDLFRFFNVTFTVQENTHTIMLCAFAMNIWYFLLYRGKNYQGEIDECLNELLTTCRLLVEKQVDLNISPEIQTIFQIILVTCYSKGFFIKKNKKIVQKYMLELDEKELLQVQPYIAYKKAQLQEVVGQVEESKHLKQEIHEKYIQAFKESEELFPMDYFVLGELELNFQKNAEKAKAYFLKGTEPVKGNNEKLFENIAFQRKCKRKLEKLQ